MAVIHQRLEITAIYQSISGPPRNKATGHASPDPQIPTAVAEMLLINNSDAFMAPPTIRGRYCGDADLRAGFLPPFSSSDLSRVFPPFSTPLQGADVRLIIGTNVFPGRNPLTDRSVFGEEREQKGSDLFCGQNF